jgi:hypothetical protein
VGRERNGAREKAERVAGGWCRIHFDFEVQLLQSSESPQQQKVKRKSKKREGGRQAQGGREGGREGEALSFTAIFIFRVLRRGNASLRFEPHAGQDANGDSTSEV